MSVEQIEARRAERKAKLAQAKEEQFALDLAALDALEVEHGDSRVARLDLDRHVPGHPTFVVLKTPSSSHYKRFCDQVARSADKNGAGERLKAQNLLGESCWVYPAKEEERKAMLEEFPGLLISVALRASQLIEAKSVEEGKG